MNLTGTYACPICGTDTPHEHSGLEIHRYREQEIEWNAFKQAEAEKLKPEQKARRDALGVERRKKLAENLAAAQNAVTRYESACHFCRDLPRGGERLKYDCGWLYGLIINRKDETASCPACSQILAAWE